MIWAIATNKAPQQEQDENLKGRNKSCTTISSYTITLQKGRRKFLRHKKKSRMIWALTLLKAPQKKEEGKLEEKEMSPAWFPYVSSSKAPQKEQDKSLKWGK